MIILDTDHITLLEWGGDASRRIERRLDEVRQADSFPTTIITYEEQMRGWMRELASCKTIADEVRLYAKLRGHIDYFETMQIFDFTEAAAVEFQRLRGLRVRIGTMDLKIAAIALAHDATLWSRNLGDFRKVPGLRVEDASR